MAEAAKMLEAALKLDSRERIDLVDLSRPALTASTSALSRKTSFDDELTTSIQVEPSQCRATLSLLASISDIVNR